MMEFAIAEFTRRTLSEHLVSDPDGQAMLDVLQAAADDAERSSETMKPPADHQAHACRVECSYCCHMRVVATIPEIIALAHFIASNFSIEAIAALRKRVIETDERTHGLSDEQWGAGRHACPLLVDKRCSVYAARPLDCRGYNSTNVKACRAAAKDYLEWDVPMDGSWMLAFKSAQAGILQALTGIGQRPRLVEVTAALRVILSDSTAIARWFGGENPFADAELDCADPEQRAFLPWVPSDELRETVEIPASLNQRSR